MFEFVIERSRGFSALFFVPFFLIKKGRKNQGRLNSCEAINSLRLGSAPQPRSLRLPVGNLAFVAVIF